MIDPRIRLNDFKVIIVPEANVMIDEVLLDGENGDTIPDLLRAALHAAT